MSALVLVDTSYWIEYFNRPEREQSRLVARLLVEDRVAIIGVVLAELLRGTRTGEEAAELRTALGAVVYVETDREVYTRAGMLGFELRRRGITVPTTDCIIAAAAESIGSRVLTLDAHFGEISKVASIGLGVEE
jgi:predicted nucleic acid-binding protein